MGILSNLTDGLLGNSKKAMLIVNAHEGESSATSLSLLAGASKMISGATGIDLGSSLLGGERAMVVQYNPSSITLQTSAQKVRFKRLLSSADSGVPAQDLRPPSTTMTVTLIFDDMNPKDAFMSEKFRVPVTPGEMVTTGASLIKTLLGYHYSVQQQTNALVSLPLRAYTKFVTFRWAKMSFTGYVSQAQARYTMFSVSGRPIRSEITLTIIQETPAKSDVGYWRDAFDERFKDGLSGSGGAKSVSESVGSMFNISGF